MNESNARPIVRIMVLGLRGIPNVQGGVETHAEHLYRLLSEKGCHIDVVARSPYVSVEQPKVWNGITLHRIWAPRIKALEAIVHTFLGTVYAAFKRPDILHIHAVGPALFTPLARVFGLRVVVTHHGPDYDRQKWGTLAKLILQLGEAMGMRFANQRIVISQVIRELVHAKYGLDSVVLPNGVILPDAPSSSVTIDQYGLERGRYVLLVSRLVPEKRHLDLIRAFSLAGLDGWKLAIVGSSDHPDSYVTDVVNLANKTPGVVMTGFQSGSALQELYSNAGVFVLPSSHEGLPIALLEALSYGLPVLASNIPANVEVGLDESSYVPLGDIAALSDGLRRISSFPLSEVRRQEIRAWVHERFDWNKIAAATLDVYLSVASGKKSLEPK